MSRRSRTKEDDFPDQKPDSPTEQDEWGFPLDWRTSNLYPDELSFQEPNLSEGDPFHLSKSWAWQFLRRNRAYQEAWRNQVADRTPGSSGHHNDVEQSSVFGLQYLIPYMSARPSFVPFSEVNAGLTFSIDFNLAIPLRPQLKRASEELEAELKRDAYLLKRSPDQLPILKRAKTINRPAKAFRKHTPSLRRYLRILDAVKAGVTRREICVQLVLDGQYKAELGDADVNFGGENRLAQELRVARRIVEWDYIRLAFS